MLPPLAVLLPLRVRQVIEVQEEGGVGEFATIRWEVQKFLGSAGHRTDVHVPHLLRRVQLQQLLLDLQVLLNISALVFELQDGFSVAIYGGDWGNHTGCEGAPSQTEQRDTRLRINWHKKMFSYSYLEDNASLFNYHQRQMSTGYISPFVFSNLFPLISVEATKQLANRVNFGLNRTNCSFLITVVSKIFGWTLAEIYFLFVTLHLTICRVLSNLLSFLLLQSCHLCFGSHLY